MIPYPHTVPKILTDAIYTTYGGHTGSSTQAQRNAAYLEAEKTFTRDVGTYVIPTVVTGTFSYDLINAIHLEHTYINSVGALFFFDTEESNYYTVTTQNSPEWSIRNKDYGIVDIHYFVESCHCHSLGQYPYIVKVSYNAGLSSGTMYQSNVLLALTIYAEIVLNEIIGYGNEAPGDAGISSYQNQSYAERRYGLVNTSFGDSPRANFAHKLLNDLRIYRSAGI